jgi:poly(3-hydroxybutyrate) depolymerase
MLRAAAIALALLLCTDPAEADVAIAPAEDGQVGAWLVAGTLPETRCDAIDVSTIAPAKGARVESSSFRLVSTARGAVDLVRALGAGTKKGPCAIAASVLAVDKELDGWLLISADGPADVSIGGERLWHEPNKGLRDGAWDALPLKLGPGRHPLIVRLRHPGEHWALAARLLDRSELLPPLGSQWVLPGAEPADAQKLASELLSVTLVPGLDLGGYAPRLTLAFENGAPRGVALPAALELSRGGQRLLSSELGSVALGKRAVHPLEAVIPLADSALGASDAPLRLRASVRVGPARADRSLIVSRRAPAALRAADGASRALKAKRPSDWLDPDAVRATLEWRATRLKRMANVKRPTEARVARAIARLEALSAEVRAGRDPLKASGWLTVARFSELDGEPEPITMQLPAASTDRARRYPLVVALHGYNGTPSSVLSAFLDVDPHSRAAKLDGFVLAPNAYGNAFYRGPGEHEVLSALDWVLAKYPIDRERVSITGVSMGGTGSAFIALRHADRFSAASPLCGYHSYFVRRDTSKRPTRPWEEARMHHWSPASWAENGRNLPLYVAHGTKDFPLENSRVLIERYRALKYDVSDEWPEIGHSVWEKTWDGARMWSWLTSKRRSQLPARITLKSDSLERGRQGWARIVQLAHPGRMGTLDATVVDPTHIQVSALQVLSFAIERTSLLSKDQTLSVAIGSATLAFTPGEPIATKLEAGSWKKGAADPKPGEKRAGAEGPIRAVFDGPLVFVWGAGNPQTRRANREVAESFARTRHGPSIHYRVISDLELDAATEKSHDLFVVGSAADHRLIAEIGARFPIRVGQGALTRPGVGAIFVHPNPRASERQLVVVTGTDAAGIWRALSLPQLLPDFLVYDAGLSPASNEQILSNGRVLSGGFFDAAWRLPADAKDSVGARKAP